ncbi:MAG TPA: FAD-binding oxidoreductase [Thermoanaerobaculia bacterium]|nr:FAD-binding oxidoreductase [Thermoanaerobaculia bacterium]
MHLARTASRQRAVAPVSRPAGTIDDASHLNGTAIREIVDVSANDELAVTQIRAALDRARAAKVHVSIAGFRHSMGGQTIAANGIVLNMLGHNRMELRGETLHVQSGAVWKDVIDYLELHGRSVAVMQSDSPFSVGGSLSVNCHGWQHLHEPIASTVEALQVLLPSGEVRHCSRTEEPALFAHVLGGYGLFGVILDAELQTVPNERYREVHQNCDVASYERLFDETVRDRDGIGMAYGRISVAPDSFLRAAALTYYEREPGPLPPLGAMHHSRLERLVFRGSAGSDYGKNLRWRLENSRLRRTQHVSRNQLLHQTIDVYLDRGPATSDILHEYFVPRGTLAAFLDRIRPLLDHRRNIDLLNITVRDVRQDQTTALPYARADVFAVVMFFNQQRTPEGEAAMQELTRELIDVTLETGGTYYLPYRLHATSEQFARAYPDAEEVFDEKRRRDPDDLFSNAWYSRYGR